MNARLIGGLMHSQKAEHRPERITTCHKDLYQMTFICTVYLVI